MTDIALLYFIKFFEKEEYAEEFVAGQLYLNTLSYFRRVEELGEGGRQDNAEGLAAWLQPGRTSIKISNPLLSHLSIRSQDLAEPVSIRFDAHDNLHLLCLYAIYINGVKFIGNSFECSPDQLQEIKKQLAIDPRCLGLGKYAVVMPAKSFIDHLKGVITGSPHLLRVVGGLVE